MPYSSSPLSPDYSKYAPEYDTSQYKQNSQRSKSFWDDWAGTIQGGGASGGTGGLGSTVGGLGGSAIGTALGGPIGGTIGGAVGSTAGDILEGGLMGGGDSGQDELAHEQAKSERLTRNFEVENSASTAGIAQWQARDQMLKKYPMLRLLNNWDFLVNKIGPNLEMMTTGRKPK